MRFDWYSATILAQPEHLIEGVRQGMMGVVEKVENTKGVSNYENSVILSDAMGERICAVLHGGSNGAPHIRASGIYSPDVASILRKQWPGHAVSRADVAIDFDGPGCWSKLFRVCRDIADESGLKWVTVGDFRENRDELSGRSVYVGSRQSAVMVRLYEKGKEITSKLHVGEASVSLDWCRLEIEVKPQAKPVRILASEWSPNQFWGCSSWSRSLAQRAANEEVTRIMMTVRKETDERRAIRHMAFQYDKSMEAVSKELGSDEALFEYIQQVRREMKTIPRQAA